MFFSSNTAEPSGDAQPTRRTRRRRRTDVASVEAPTEFGYFNPDHPLAFSPPDYDELSMTNSEPPKYDDIQMMTSSQTNNSGSSVTNAAFEPEEVGPPPEAASRPPHADSRNPAPTTTGTAGSERAARDDTRAPATTPSDDGSLPPPYEAAVASVPMSSQGATA